MYTQPLSLFNNTALIESTKTNKVMSNPYLMVCSVNAEDKADNEGLLEDDFEDVTITMQDHIGCSKQHHLTMSVASAKKLVSALEMAIKEAEA